MTHQITLPYSQFEQRSPYYNDIEELISPGFLSHMLLVNGVPISLRSPSPGDLYMLRHRIGYDFAIKNYDWKVWSLATCTWMIGGQPLLDYPELIPKIAQAYRNLPFRVLDALFSIFVNLYSRIESATRGIRSYCYETTSRFTWFAYGKAFPSGSEITGIPGTTRLGLNPIQKMWVYFNQIEDYKNEVEVRWSNAKFIASAHNPKGVKQVNTSDNSRRQREDRDRQETHDKFYYWSIGLVDDNYDGLGLRRKKTDAELENELKAWVAGEEDLHDRVVREFKESVRKKYEYEKLERERQYQRLLEEPKSPLKPSTRLVGYTPDQIEALMREKGLQPRVGGVKRISESDHAHILYQKYLQNNETPAPKGGWKVNKLGQLERSSEEGSQKSLNEQIQNRRVQVEPEKE